MSAKKLILLFVSHLSVGAFGVALGIYLLPILIAPSAPTATEVSAASSQASFAAEFRRDLKDSDTFHWGEGKVSIGSKLISLDGSLAPGPDYKLYLSPEFVETESSFNELKPKMQRVADVKTFENFVVSVPEGVDISRYNTVVIWCETFGEFITAAQYR